MITKEEYRRALAFVNKMVSYLEVRMGIGNLYWVEEGIVGVFLKVESFYNSQTNRFTFVLIFLNLNTSKEFTDPFFVLRPSHYEYDSDIAAEFVNEILAMRQQKNKLILINYPK